jgi:DNA relaxase NicK
MLDASIVSAGIDYISATMLHTNVSVLEWYTDCVRLIETIGKDGNDVISTRRLGYEGFASGGSFVGVREDGYLCTISGERAQTGFDTVYRHKPHVSRLDVQCTVKTPDGAANTASVARDAVARANAQLSGAAQRDAMLVESLLKGSTVYVCSRKSEQFARIYDKDKESGEERYKNCWRYEVQLKNNLATKTAELFRVSEYAQPAQAAVFVRQWLRKRGVHAPWKADAELSALPSETSVPSDVEARLRWLRTQVRPVIRRLLKLGLRDSILEALDIPDAKGGEVL